MDENLRLENQVCFALHRAARAVQDLYRPRLAALGITYPQYLVLLALWSEGPATVSGLGQKLALDSGTLSPLLKRLTEAGLVTKNRSTDDGRVVHVHLTEAGKTLRQHVGSIQECLVGQLTLSDEELLTLRSLAQRVSTSTNHARQEDN